MANEIQIEADSMEEARMLARSQIPKGTKIVSENILEYDYKVLRGTGYTVEGAFKALEEQVPQGAAITRNANVSAPVQHTIDHDVDHGGDAVPEELTAKYQVSWMMERANKGAKGAPREVSGVQLVKKGRRGFLGIGRKPWKYRVTIVQNAEVALSYKQKARIVFTYAPKTLFDALFEGTPIEELKALLNGGVSIEVLKPNGPWEGGTPLLVAAGYGNVEAVKILLENKANVKFRDDGGYTPLMVCKHEEILQLLIDHGADVNAATKWGATKLSAAAKDGEARNRRAAIEQWC